MKKIGMGEFVSLMAFAMSLMALSIDAMLPAFTDIITDLNVGKANDMQLMISLLFTGLALGQLFYGPLSDSIGRKPAMFIGFSMFIVGCVISIFATNYEVMLASRFLQGLGAAGPRVVAVALIRDRFHGSEMARVMSFIMTVFILVPVLAPSLGQLILFVGDWRTIFETLIVMTIAAMIWTALRQPETLPLEGRPPFTFRKLKIAFGIVLGNRVTMIATVVSGLIFASFFSYLNVSQQILEVQYQLGTKFPLYFAILAIGVGCASLLNSSLVMKFGMHHLASLSLTILMLLSWGFLGMVWFFSGHPPLWMFMVVFFVMFFAIGVLFGNLNAIAMEPLGQVAGTGAAVVGSVSSLIAVLLGYLFGNAYNGTLFPMAISFALLSTISLVMIFSIKQLWKE